MPTPVLGSQPRALLAPQAQSSLGGQSWTPGQGAEASLPLSVLSPKPGRPGPRREREILTPSPALGSQELESPAANARPGSTCPPPPLSSPPC